MVGYNYSGQLHVTSLVSVVSSPKRSCWDSDIFHTHTVVFDPLYQTEWTV